MKLALAMAGAILVASAGPGSAQSSPAIAAARDAGQVGERFDGFLGYATAVAPSVRSQVDAVNIRRRALYSRLGAAKGVSPHDVGVTAGCELLDRVDVGEVYLLADNVWRRRVAGQARPVPDYCRP